MISLDLNGREGAKKTQPNRELEPGLAYRSHNPRLRHSSEWNLAGGGGVRQFRDDTQWRLAAKTHLLIAAGGGRRPGGGAVQSGQRIRCLFVSAAGLGLLRAVSAGL